MAIRGQAEGYSWDGNVLSLGCINASVLVVQDITTRGSRLEAKEIFLYYFLQLHLNLRLCHD